MGRVIVLGSINMDCVAKVERHPNPGETIPGNDLQYYPGGKGANQAVAAARMGAKTVMLGKVGTDGLGENLKHFLKENEIDVTRVERASCATGTAFIAVNAAGENTIIVIPGANGEVSQESFQACQFTPKDILLCQNEIPSATVLDAFKAAKEGGATVVYNPAPAIEVPDALFTLADIVVLNETEYAFYESALEQENSAIILTKGASGIEIKTVNGNLSVNGHKVDVVDTTGAGDCFTGVLAARLSQGEELEEAARFSNRAAAISVQRVGAGTSMPTVDEVIAFNDKN